MGNVPIFSVATYTPRGVFMGLIREGGIDMKTRIGAVVLVTGLIAGCASGPLTGREKGALAGGALGAGAGALIGKHAVKGHTVEGAAIGGAAGALGGAIIGDQYDARSQPRDRYDDERYDRYDRYDDRYDRYDR